MGKVRKKITKRAVFALVLCCLMPVVAFGQSGGATIYGSIISSYEWVGESHAGLYSFNTEGGAVFTPVKIEPGLCAQGGGVYAGHAYYSFSVDDNTLYVYDADTWEQTAAYPTDIAALDLAYDPTTGNIYGCFVDNGAKLGVLVPEEGSYEYIADFNMSLAALVCSNEGQLYGIGSDGLLYRIDKATAAMAEIGNTGIYPMMAQSATIDPNTGKCYWAATSFGATGLYEVDLDTGNASLLYLFPNEEEITGLFILEEVPADAPAKANGLQVDFPNGSTTGSIRFVMPTMTCGGAALDGTLDYTLLMNDEVKEGTGQPGETISLENITLEAGDYKFVLTVSNDKGTGERAVVSQWIGMDAPAAVENLTLKKQSEATVALSWEAPRTGIHQGYVDAASLRYRIVRYPGNVVLHEDYPQTSFTEDIEAGKLAQYWYVVTPAAGGMEGEEASSNKVVMGPGYEMPYEEDFSTTTRFNQFTLMDANGDGRTWQQDIAMEVAQYMADTPEKADDWLVTPPLKLDEDGYYQLSFSVKCNSMDAHRISVALGNLPEVESLSTVLLPSQDFNTNFEWLVLEAKFRVPQSATYYIGFHAESDGGAYSFDLDNVSVRQIASANAPAAVSNLKVQPGEKGALQATVSFDAPETTIKGEPLDGLTKVELYRGDVLVEEFAEPTPGQSLAFDDKEPLSGFNTYKAIAYNESGNGDECSQQAYIGIDIPQAVGSITLSELEYGVVTVAWEAPSAVGINGGYVDTDALTYTVKRGGWEEVASGIEERSFVDRIEGLGDAQRTVAYTITAASSAGTGLEGNSSYLSVGIPYEMPFHESFPQGRASYTEWIYTPAMGSNMWMPMYSMDSQDGDDGLMSLSGMGGNPMETRLLSPKIRIGNTEKPVMEFYVRHSEIDDELSLEVFSPQMEAETVATVNLRNGAGAWNLCTVDMSAFKGQEFIQLAFVTRNALEMDQTLEVDNICLRDDLQHNLAASAIDAPAKIKVGQTKEISVTVANVGQERAEGYTVSFYNGDELIGTESGVPVEAGQSVAATLAFTPEVSDLHEAAIRAVVDYAADQNVQNNATGTVVVEIEEPGYPKVGDLAAKGTGEAVELSWSAPDLANLPPEASVEDFESYEAFTITDLGEWTLVDGDQSTYSMGFRTSAGEWITYPNAEGAMSFQVIDLSQIIATKDDGWDSVSGDKILISPYSYPKDDWLVSPALSPVEQDITLNAKSLNFGNYGLESFTVLYSTGSKETGSFVEIETVEGVPTEWTEYSFRLPAEAKYFAIHLSYASSAIFFDDISYIPATAKPQELAIEGYNVYRDGAKLNDAPVADARYTDESVEAGTEYTYAVTVVYDKGESGYSNEVKASSSTFIGGEETAKVAVYAVPGSIRVVNPDGGPVAVYSVDGKTVFAASGESVMDIPAGSGCYIVRAGGSAVKVFVP